MRGSRAVGHVGGWPRQRPIAERDCTRAAREVAAEKSAKESGRYLAERDCTRAAREVAAEKSAKESGRYQVRGLIQIPCALCFVKYCHMFNRRPRGVDK